MASLSSKRSSSNVASANSTHYNMKHLPDAFYYSSLNESVLHARATQKSLGTISRKFIGYQSKGPSWHPVVVIHE